MDQAQHIVDSLLGLSEASVRRFVQRAGIHPLPLGTLDAPRGSTSVYLVTSEGQIDTYLHGVPIYDWHVEEMSTFLILNRDRGGSTTTGSVLSFDVGDVVMGTGGSHFNRGVHTVYNLVGTYPEEIRRLIAKRLLRKILEFDEHDWLGYYSGLGTLGMFPVFAEAVASGLVPDERLYELPFGGKMEAARLDPERWADLKLNDAAFSEEGVHLAFSDWSDPNLIECFDGDGARKSAEQLFSGEAHSWFDHMEWQTPKEVFQYLDLDDKSAQQLRELLEGREALNEYDEPMDLSKEALQAMSNAEIAGVIEELSVDNQIEDIADAVSRAYSDADASAQENAYHTHYANAFEDMIGSKGEWKGIGGENRLVFLVEHSIVNAWLQAWFASNGEHFDGMDMYDLLHEYLDIEDAHAKVSSEHFARPVEDAHFNEQLRYHLDEIR